MKPKAILEFLHKLEASLSSDLFNELKCTSPRDKETGLKKRTLRKVSLKKGDFIQCVDTFTNKDITKNLTTEEVSKLIARDIEMSFEQFVLIDNQNIYHLNIGKKAKLSISENKGPKLSNVHNKEKQYLIPQGADFLQVLGIASNNKKIKSSYQSKYRQINKFTEIIDSILPAQQTESPFKIFDMGSGSAYLSFALYHHLTKNKSWETTITGIELRKALVEKCNTQAKLCNFQKLSFEEGLIITSEISDCNMLIALHACDTATDDAIYKGIKANADYIICSPCCHRQVRKSMQSEGLYSSITRHGILLERQAELLTDSIRALLLESKGYKTRIIEFISTEHTSKNLLIIAEKRKNTYKSPDFFLKEIEVLKTQFGIPSHYLEDILYRS